jgi:hypothetical protein
MLMLSQSGKTKRKVILLSSTDSIYLSSLVAALEAGFASNVVGLP